MAECHPVGFRWVMEAKQRGATIIHVDPRFTRTSAVADMYVPIRAGTDIVFLGALISYVISNERYFKEYVVSYTNASAIVREDYQDTEDLDGLFSGWQEDKAQYGGPTWRYEGTEHKEQEANRVPDSHAERAAHFAGPKVKAHETDATLQHPRCVFQIVKRHFQRYTPEMVEEVCGITPDQFHKVAEILCRNSGRRAHVRLLLCSRLDAALRRRAIHPGCCNSSVAARQYRPARRRHPRPARPRYHSGLNRHPHSLRSSARLSSRCPKPAPTTRSMNIWSITPPDRAGGRSFRSTSSRFSKLGTGRLQLPRTASASTTFRRLPAIIRT